MIDGVSAVKVPIPGLFYFSLDILWFMVHVFEQAIISLKIMCTYLGMLAQYLLVSSYLIWCWCWPYIYIWPTPTFMERWQIRMKLAVVWVSLP